MNRVRIAWSLRWLGLGLLAVPARAEKADPDLGKQYGSTTVAPRQQIRFTAPPGTLIRLDEAERSVGSTGILDWPKLDPGTYTYVAWKPDFEPSEGKVKITVPKLYPIKVTLKPCPNVILLADRALAQARVQLDGKPIALLGDIMSRSDGNVDAWFHRQPNSDTHACGLPAGSRQLTVELEGFTPFQTLLQTTVTQVPVRVAMHRTTGMLLLEVNLQGAEVVLDGRSMGTLPPANDANSKLLIARLPPKEYTLQIRDAQDALNVFDQLQCSIQVGDDKETPSVPPAASRGHVVMVKADELTRLRCTFPADPLPVSQPFAVEDDSVLWSAACEGGNSDACAMMGWWYRWHGDTPSAERAFKAACNERSPDACEAAGWLMEKRGDTLGAIELYRKACKARPSTDRARPLACYRPFLAPAAQDALDPTLAFSAEHNTVDVTAMSLGLLVGGPFLSDNTPVTLQGSFALEYAYMPHFGLSVGMEGGGRFMQRIRKGGAPTHLGVLNEGLFLGLRGAPGEWLWLSYVTATVAAGVALSVEETPIFSPYLSLRFGLGIVRPRAFVGGLRVEAGIMVDYLSAEIVGPPLDAQIARLKESSDISAFLAEHKAGEEQGPLLSPYIQFTF